MSASNTFDLDGFIARLTAARDLRPGTKIDLTEGEVKSLCLQARHALLADSVLLELNLPMTLCGDVHGQFFDLLRIFKSGGCPSQTRYLFLSDYVDRGHQSIETICLLLAYKVKYPGTFFMLRGNHECSETNKKYGFQDECIGPGLNDVQQIKALKRPCDVPEVGLLCDILWSDPEPGLRGWRANDVRNCAYYFGADVFQQFMGDNKFELLVRAHQVKMNGFEYLFRRQLVTLFSAPNYGGNHGNSGAIMKINEKLQMTCKTIKPEFK